MVLQLVKSHHHFDLAALIIDKMMCLAAQVWRGTFHVLDDDPFIVMSAIIRM
jgi:hypothetical protein